MVRAGGLETFAWAEVVTGPGPVTRFEGEELAVVDIDDRRMPPGLDGPRAQRDAQRGSSGFGALADRDIVNPRRPRTRTTDRPSGRWKWGPAGAGMPGGLPTGLRLTLTR
ncbi:hypothetical protein [Streptomyces sp. NPDC087862]|uniref:hypothetical protein n=1 Tax=Streptomyces sp. NPDC087862 TaxID=3365813 RepID=UPI00380CE59C